MSTEFDVKFNDKVNYSPRWNEVLDPNESLAKIKEELFNQKQQFRNPAQNLAVGPNNQEASEGTPLEINEFVRRLAKAAPNLLIEPSCGGGAIALRTLTMDEDPQSDTFGKVVKKYVGGFPVVAGKLPEFSFFVNDQHGIPVREIRGWRTVLLMLIAQNAVSYAATKKEFGDPPGQRGELWREQLRERAVVVVSE